MLSRQYWRTGYGSTRTLYWLAPAHRFAASLRRVSIRLRLRRTDPGRSIVARRPARAAFSFHSHANIGVPGMAVPGPCIGSRLRIALAFGEQPTGLPLISSATVLPHISVVPLSPSWAAKAAQAKGFLRAKPLGGGLGRRSLPTSLHAEAPDPLR